MYYICRFSDTWAIYDKANNKSRQLTADEIELLKKLFGSLINDNKSILTAAKIEAIPPNRLQQLPMPGK